MIHFTFSLNTLLGILLLTAATTAFADDFFPHNYMSKQPTYSHQSAMQQTQPISYEQYISNSPQFKNSSTSNRSHNSKNKGAHSKAGPKKYTFQHRLAHQHRFKKFTKARLAKQHARIKGVRQEMRNRQKQKHNTRRNEQQNPGVVASKKSIFKGDNDKSPHISKPTVNPAI